ncbi:trifunctional hydroxymethylpyrimidine kinase/phosphomethylpyrimidine kinase/thiaminase KNAG_0K01220 [Huiozyma naganishii CBS 8797]|uniref:Pyridoxamine kinase/Phosphomethylpyrimidine kinase domain-containing protein n=1 Tax=Huiozyma naganishii (strain ATCC MYA-139 / BCRC 22969 / CBS 8797 / KCTC 17520 / NBRC 10181 / NCYC 3082 / Yp74L-3) TaxID=1071383 RepID=J7S3A9_HUIN7|nr:hypothetical protein KNAG_0K01220 [Kazachstania naganishii CBS 8797]CCK72487.1 hypothetical protein KNAG_0K01220 [Kazachstania naganishii CBS 8797]
MSFSKIVVNTPPPYLSLSKDEHLPVVMTVAGSDCSGGAGVEADVKTISAHRCYAMTCVAALTIQTPLAVYGIQDTPGKVVSQILDVNLKDMKCDVIKTGMLTVDVIHALSEKLQSIPDAQRPKLVVDPVLVATVGSALASEDVVTVIKKDLTPMADIITPNIPECFKLVGKTCKIEKLEDVFQLAKDVSKECNCANVLVKGGHIPWSGSEDRYITDVLLVGAEKKFIVFKGHFTETTHTHGTGCTLASAIASNVARGYSIPQSVYGAIEYVQNAVSIGCEVAQDHVKSNGPINHVYAVGIPLERMVEDECFSAHEIVVNGNNGKVNPQITNDLPLMKKDFTSYLENHPKVKPHWESYVNHEFVKKIADGTLKRSKFQFFIEQDYAYLVDYARVHCIAASKAPLLSDMEKELTIVGGVKKEMVHHKERLKSDFGVKDDSYFDHIKRGPALKTYSRYFADVAVRGNWAELVTSLTPCLMGYGTASKLVEKNITTKDPMYLAWLDVYNSDDYQNAMVTGRKMMNEIAATYPPEQIETLITIYAEVCELETKFWDAALNYE